MDKKKQVQQCDHPHRWIDCIYICNCWCASLYGNSECLLARVTSTLGRVPEQVLWGRWLQIQPIFFHNPWRRRIIYPSSSSPAALHVGFTKWCREDSRVRVLLERPPGSWIGENVRQDRGWTLGRQCYTWEDPNFVHLRRVLTRIIARRRIIRKMRIYWW